MTIGIYKLTINNKVYIGQSVNIEERFANHKSLLKNSKHYNNKIQEAYNCDSNIVLEIIHITNNINELNALEIEYMQKYNSTISGLNICSGGVSGRGLEHPSLKYTKEQIINVMYLLLNVDSSIKEISTTTGVSESTVRHISRREVHLWLEDMYPEETKKLLRMSKDRARNSSQRKTYKFTKLKSPDGVIYEVFPSINAFGRMHGLDPNKVGQVMLGKRNTHKNWIGIE